MTSLHRVCRESKKGGVRGGRDRVLRIWGRERREGEERGQGKEGKGGRRGISCILFRMAIGSGWQGFSL